MKRIVVHTDVLLDHLTTATRPSALRRIMASHFCYTTVFQAIELFAVMRSERERKAVEDCLSAMKLLGLNPKRSARYGELFRGHPRHRAIDLLVAGLCLESGLPLLTNRSRDFRGIDGLKVVRPGAIIVRWGARGGGRRKNAQLRFYSGRHMNG